MFSPLYPVKLDAQSILRFSVTRLRLVHRAWVFDERLYIRLTQQDGTSCKAECYEDKETVRVIAEESVALRQVLEGVTRAGRAIVEYSAS